MKLRTLAILVLSLCSCVAVEPAGDQDAGACRLPSMLPETRDETATSASPASSNLINRIQDCIIAGKVGASELTLHAMNGLLWDPDATAVPQPQWNKVGQYIEANQARAAMSMALPLRVGDRIKKVSIMISGAAPNTADITSARMWKIPATMGGPDLLVSNEPQNNVAGAWAALDLDLEATNDEYTILTGEAIYIEFVASDAGIRLGNISVFYDHP